MATFACGNEDDALDIVQDSMLGFVSRYASRPEEEWPPLFYRVLQSRITDWHRRSSLRNRIMGWFGLADGDDGDDDPLQRVPDGGMTLPDRLLEGSQFGSALEAALRALPLRQQQAFLMRAWEGLDTKETAIAMGCSEGSVKTHYFRALQTLREKLEEHKP